MNKVFIIGGNGQVGYCLKQQTEVLNMPAFVTTRDMLDVTDYEQLKKLVATEKPSVLINASAYTNVEQAEDDYEKAYEVNCVAVGNMAKVAHELHIPLIHISTDYVFDGTCDRIYTEDKPTNPINAYGKSKLLGENAVIENHDQYVILRTSWVFGQHGKNFVKTMMRLFCSKDSLKVVDDQIGGPTFAGDIAKAILDIVDYLHKNPEKQPWGIYNFSGFPNVTWCTFTKNIYAVALEKKLVDKYIKIEPVATEFYPTKAKRPKNSQLSMKKIKDVFDIDPSDWSRELKYNLEKYCEQE